MTFQIPLILETGKFKQLPSGDGIEVDSIKIGNSIIDTNEYDDLIINDDLIIDGNLKVDSLTIDDILIDTDIYGYTSIDNSVTIGGDLNIEGNYLYLEDMTIQFVNSEGDRYLSFNDEELQDITFLHVMDSFANSGGITRTTHVEVGQYSDFSGVGKICYYGTQTPCISLFVDRITMGGQNVNIGKDISAQNLLTLTNESSTYSEPGIDLFGRYNDTSLYNFGRIYAKGIGHPAAWGYEKGSIILATPTAANTFVDTLIAKDSKVGILETEPLYELHITNDSSTPIIGVQNNNDIGQIAVINSTNDLFFGTVQGDMVISANDDTKLHLGVDNGGGANKMTMTLTEEGKVTIGGKVTPQNFLDIQDDSSTYSEPGIDFFGRDGTSSIYNSGRIYGKIINDGAFDYTDCITVIAAPTSEGTFIDTIVAKNGKVIIGNTSQTKSQNRLNIVDNTTQNTTPGIDFFSTINSGTTLFNSGRIYATFETTGYDTGRVTIASPLGVNSFVDVLSVRDSKVGIGTTDPERTLHVEGGSFAYTLIKSTSADSVAGFIWENDAQEWMLKVDGAASNDDLVYRDLSNSKDIVWFQKSTGYVGIGASPTTLLELEHTQPYITLHNTTDEDTDGGRESYIIFKGDQSGGEETTLGWIKASHYGTADDEKGMIRFNINDGSDADSPTNILDLDPDNGLNIKNYNGRALITTQNSGVSAPGNPNAIEDGDKWIFWNSSTLKASIGFNSGEWWQSFPTSGANGKYSWYLGQSASPVLTMQLSNTELTSYVKEIISRTLQSTTPQTFLQFIRPLSASQYYPGVVDFDVYAYGAGGSPFNPQTQLDIKLKSDENSTLAANTTVMSLLADGRVGINQSVPLSGTYLDVNGTTIVRDKLAFTQTDLNEYIDSDADGYIDYYATTAHRFHGTVEFQDGIIVNEKRIDHTDSPYTILTTDSVIFIDTDGGAVEVDLPAGSSGMSYKLINVGSSGNNVTVDPNGTEQIYASGAGTTYTLLDGESITIHYNATEGWW